MIREGIKPPPLAWLSQEKKGGRWRFVIQYGGEGKLISDCSFSSQATASVALRNYLYVQGYKITSVRVVKSKRFQWLLN